MADLGTLALGTFDTAKSSDTAITGTEPVLEVIASADDTDYVADTANNSHTGLAVFALDDMPSDFGTMDTLKIQARYAFDVSPTNNTWNSLAARVLKSDGTTALVETAVIASSITTTTPTNSSVITFTGLDTAATKSDWDGAVVELRFHITKNKGGDSAEERVFAAELTGTYTIATSVSIPIAAYHHYHHNLGS